MKTRQSHVAFGNASVSCSLQESNHGQRCKENRSARQSRRRWAARRGGGPRPRGRRGPQASASPQRSQEVSCALSCSFSRLAPVQRGRRRFRCLLSLETEQVLCQNLSAFGYTFLSFFVLHIILVFFTRKTAKLLTRSPNCKASPGETVFSSPVSVPPQLAGIKREKQTLAAQLRSSANLKPFLEKERLYLEDV